MLHWIVGVGGVVAAFLLWLREQRKEAGSAPRALPPSSPLVERLGPLLRAAQAVRRLALGLTAEDLRVCAAAEVAMSQAGVEMWGLDRRTGFGGAVGPGQQAFVDVRAALSAVEADDRRDLAETGFDLARLEAALVPFTPAETWRQRLLVELEAMEKAAAQVRDQPYR